MLSGVDPGAQEPEVPDLLQLWGHVIRDALGFLSLLHVVREQDGVVCIEQVSQGSPSHHAVTMKKLVAASEQWWIRAVLLGVDSGEAVGVPGVSKEAFGGQDLYSQQIVIMSLPLFFRCPARLAEA